MIPAVGSQAEEVRRVNWSEENSPRLPSPQSQSRSQERESGFRAPSVPDFSIVSNLGYLNPPKRPCPSASNPHSVSTLAMVLGAARKSLFQTWFAVEAIPIYAVVVGAVGGAGWYMTRLATRPDIVWDRRNNPTPWMSVEQGMQTKLMSVNQKFDKVVIRKSHPCRSSCHHGPVNSAIQLVRFSSVPKQANRYVKIAFSKFLRPRYVWAIGPLDSSSLLKKDGCRSTTPLSMANFSNRAIVWLSVHREERVSDCMIEQTGARAKTGVKRNQQQYDLPLKILSYDELYGWTMDKIVEQVGRKNNCTYLLPRFDESVLMSLDIGTFCGVFRRQALDRGAAQLGVDHIVTGHNADDIAETIESVMRGDIARLGRCTQITTQSEDTIKRSKPFKYAYEKEIVLYAHFKKLDYFSTECIYSPDAYRGHARAFLKDLEAARPSAIVDIIHSGEAFELREEAKTVAKAQRKHYVSHKVLKLTKTRRDLFEMRIHFE
ncbi:cytoplasmic tRNA 2-thiolation protein 1 [Rhizoctonia solani AG-1 IA]|uniref:Cytoplasmic tRNA 2-thiolation protein 1 n=1 Tax=Thanatephorus cucumeris (strain AG1-IA) TaxID=983506 RepID=L8X932_THACA|nr:cytoplasmic tRNA 2-thiolation protein 1 [Rhizoctonia solani AG-1 IA]